MNAMDRPCPGIPQGVPVGVQSDLDRLKSLRLLREACLRNLRRLRKQPQAFAEEIAREEAVLSGVNREIQHQTRLLTDPWN